MGRAAGGRREHYLVCRGVRDPSRSHETLRILGAPSTKAHNDVAALLVGSTRPLRVTPASPVLRVSGSICFKNRIGWPCGLQRLRPFCHRRRASNQLGKAGLRSGASVQTPMAVNPTLMHRFSSRASLPTTERPRDHQTCTNVAQFHFQDRSRRASSNTSLRSLISAIENARFTCHRSQALIPHAEPSAGVRNSARRVAQASTGCSSTRPRPCQQASTTSAPKTRAARTTDHSRRARNVTAAPADVASQQRPTAAPRRGRE